MMSQTWQHGILESESRVRQGQYDEQAEVRHPWWGGGMCANCSQRVPKVPYGKAKFHHQTHRARQSANRDKGSEPGGAWDETRGGGKVKSKWRRDPIIATKGNCVPEVQFSGPRGGR